VLPALTLHRLPGEGATYTRRPEWTHSLESLWSILAKWQFVNRLPYWSLARCVSALSRANLYEGVDLRVLESFDLQALAECTGVPHGALCGGACVATLACSGLAFACTSLRWCRACMNEGFHATLFQFMPITRCPIHRDRLIDVCPRCRNAIHYRLDTAFAANPLACPNCSGHLVADPTVLLQPYMSAGRSHNVWAWQRLLAKYAHWYPDLPRPRQPIVANGCGNTPDEVQPRVARSQGRLTFIGALQDVLHTAPLLASVSELRACTALPDWHCESALNRTWTTPFTRQLWPHFQGFVFVDLCRRFSHFHAVHREQDGVPDRRVTRWWRRAWQGASARVCSTHTAFADPPFGVAEWLAFSAQPALETSAASNHQALALRFEQDLAITWSAWSVLLRQMPSSAPKGLHPRLVPPRGCWLNEPTFLPASTALGQYCPRIPTFTAQSS
jgi:hypothetical protein